jgi:hypothetical protein
MREAFRTIIKWIRFRPILTILFVMVLSSMATCLAFRGDWLFYGGLAYTILALFIGYLIFRDAAKIMLIAFLASCLVIPVQAQEQKNRPTEVEIAAAGGCAAAAVAVVVIAVGGYCVYKIVKFCQKHFPKEEKKDTNKVDRVEFNLAESDSYAAAWNFGEMGSCWDEDPCAQLMTYGLIGMGIFPSEPRFVGAWHICFWSC